MRPRPRIVSCLAAIALALCVGLPSAIAKKTPARTPAPAAALSSDPAIAAIESTYLALTDLTASFVQTTTVALVGRTVEKKGIFRFKKGGKLRIDYQGKDAKLYVSDGSTLWISVPGDEASLQTYAVNDETVPREALSFLSGFGRLTKEFVVSPSRVFPEAGDGATALHLVPRTTTKHYESLDALFGPDHLLSELLIKNISGNTTRYRFAGVKTNQNLPDGLFTLSSGKATPDTLPQ